MKTHELAKALNLLAKILRASPNMELSEFDFTAIENQKISKNEDIPFALGALVSLYNVDKNQWNSIIKEYGFDIEITPRDSKRNLIDKVAKYLVENPKERKKLTESVKKRSAKASPELMEALSILLK